MRTTVTLDPDTEAMVRRLMSEQGISFKRALNDAIRGGATPSSRQRGPVTRARSMGASSADLDRALALAGVIEDDELLRRMRVGK